MIWSAYVNAAYSFGNIAGLVIGPCIQYEKQIRRVGRWATRETILGGCLAVSASIGIAPLILAQPVTSQQFGDLERRVRKVETVIERIDDPDGLLRTNARKLSAIESQVQINSGSLARQTWQTEQIGKAVEELPSQILKYVILALSIFAGAFKLVVWIIPHIKTIATTETGEKPKYTPPN